MHSSAFQSLAASLRSVVLAGAACLMAAARAQQVPVAVTPVDRSAANGETIEMSAFTVSGKADDGYRSIHTTSGSRTVENLKDVANSISIMNRELIEDLAVTSMAELSEFAITGERNPDPQNQEQYVFRGIVNSYQLRDGFIWYLPVDAFNLERAEILRGPNAFLYGEADPGGSLNQLTKRAGGRESTRMRLMAGSFDLYRAEIDSQRFLTASKNLSLRANAVYQRSGSQINYVKRDFHGVALAIQYKPFKNTTVDVTYEFGDAKENRATTMLLDRFSTTELNNATSAVSNTVGGPTYFSGLGRVYNTVNTRISSGLNVFHGDESLLAREINFDGPDATFNTDSQALNISVEQRVGRNLTLQATFNLQDSNADRMSVAGNFNGIYVDRNATLPDGTPNPYLNQYYTERYFQRRVRSNIVRDWRLSGVYDLDLKFTKQRIIGTVLQHQDNPTQVVYSEFVEIGSPAFSGTLTNADTTAAHSANSTILQRNYFRRRHYLIDGDAASLTAQSATGGVPTRMFIDPAANGGNAGRTVDRRFYSPSFGLGSAGSYFKGRVRSMIGWRKDAFNSRVARTYYNPVTDSEFDAPGKPRTFTNTELSAYNFGGVVHLTKWLSASVNYAESYRISLGVGADGLLPGTKQGLPTGDGYEAGLRWSFLGGRLESNWTYYTTNQLRNRDVPAPTANLMTELMAIFPDLNQSGRDTQTVNSSGLEFETVATLTNSLTLTWNLATNEVETQDTIPELRGLQAAAAAQNRPTPLTDAFVATIVDGTPVRGYTKVRSNLFGRYRVREGALKGLSLGGGFQYRDRTFLGNLDRNRDGFAEMQWARGYTLWNGMVGYSTRLWNHPVNFALNVNNIFDKDYLRAGSLTGASWGIGRTYRFSTNVSF